MPAPNTPVTDTHGGYVNAASSGNQRGAERLANWLALLTLLALGVVWPGSEAAGPARSAPRTLARAAEPSPSPLYR
jgi:hypothetical protein